MQRLREEAAELQRRLDDKTAHVGGEMDALHREMEALRRRAAETVAEKEAAQAETQLAVRRVRAEEEDSKAKLRQQINDLMQVVLPCSSAFPRLTSLRALVGYAESWRQW